MRLSDQELVHLILQGQQQHFAELVDRYSEAIFQLALRIVKNQNDVDDVVQETFQRAWRGLAKFGGRAVFATWITRIGLNCAVELVKTRERQTFPRLVGGDVESDAPGPDRLVFSSQMQPRIMSALAQLSERERAAFTCRHVEDMPVRKISALLGSDDVATRNSIFRAVDKLRTALEPFVRLSHASDKRTAD
jgi:RNA polymerase sigma-70 factor (ECF subfamily)